MPVIAGAAELDKLTWRRRRMHQRTATHLTHACLPSLLAPAPAPPSQIAVMGLLPIVGADVAPTNARYAALAAAQGALFVDCTAGMDPTDYRLFEDGIHPTAAGQEMVVACLRPAVDPLLAA